MNTIKKFRFAFIAVFSLLLINSCVKDDDWSAPPVHCTNNWVPNMTMHELFDLIDSDGALHTFTEDTILEGWVVSSDSTGNFFKTISIQDKPENPTIALQVEMDRVDLFNIFPIGSKIAVNLKGIYAGYDRGMMKIGELFDSNGVMRVGRMADYQIDSHVVKTCEPIGKITPVVFNNLDEMFSQGVFNTAVTIHNIQFDTSELGTTYADAVNQETVDKILIDKNGTTVKLRNSGFADFAGEPIPSGSGSITVVMSGYDANNNGIVSPGEYQLLINSTDDVNFDEPRFGGGGGGTGDEFFSCLLEDFSSFSENTEDFPNYENIPVENNRKWRVTEFGGNKYIQVSAFNATGNVVSYFVVPVDFSKADVFSFKTNDGYNNGDPLKVYYSTDYVPGGDLSSATLENITSSFTISTGHTDGYGDGFVDSGEYDLSALSGDGVIIFSYEGSGSGITTTIQIDDIMIVDNDDPDCDLGGGGDDPEPPSGDAYPLFPGYDFENWQSFLDGLNNFGLQPYASQSMGTGQDGSASLLISTDTSTTSGNDYVFTNLASDGLPTEYSKITFFMKGTSDKSVSLNVYKTDGDGQGTDGYYKFNLGSLNQSAVILASPSNQYTGTIDTQGEWVQITLDLSAIHDMNVTDTSWSIFALKIGKNANYDLHFDNFTVE